MFCSHDFGLNTILLSGLNTLGRHWDMCSYTLALTDSLEQFWEERDAFSHL